MIYKDNSVIDVDGMILLLPPMIAAQVYLVQQHATMVYSENTMCIRRDVNLPNKGIDVDVEGAYSTKMSRRIRKLPKMLIAKNS